jgi:Ran-binding protein 1
MSDNVFSMFGGGAKREKKEEKDDHDEPSGSSKAQKAAAEDEVRISHKVNDFAADKYPGRGP